MLPLFQAPDGTWFDMNHVSHLFLVQRMTGDETNVHISYRYADGECDDIHITFDTHEEAAEYRDNLAKNINEYRCQARLGG